MSSTSYIAYPPTCPQQSSSVRWDSHYPHAPPDGIYMMGPPSDPLAHPDNRFAAARKPVCHGSLHADPSMQYDSSVLRHTPPSSASVYGTPVVGNPYIATTPPPKIAAKGPVHALSQHLSKCNKKFEEYAKKVEEVAGNLWQHLRTGPNLADTIWGRLTQGAKVLHDGHENVFRRMFATVPSEKLCKSYACYLSTTTGPVAGTLYISTAKITFCSDRPLPYQPHPGQTAWNYYRVVLPLDRLQFVSPAANQVNPAEKYIQLVTVDQHVLWFMGFVSYDKAFRNLQKALQRES